ncbi:MAG TPA: sugar ABC transporter permease [Halanaerobiales bacterium]|nr:sugar ABC transporter permease [Halanaerobiales bacterium]
MEYRSDIFKKRYKNFILVSTIPVVTFYVIFMIFPIVQSLYYSLFKWSGFSAEKEYIGLENYGELIGDSLFLETVVNSFQYVVFGAVIIIGITLMFTYVITNYKSRKLKDLVQMILFVPNTISPVALALLWGFILNTRWGLLNGLLERIGLGFLQRGWLGNDYIFGAALSLLVWIHVGFFIVMYVAAADRIPYSLYESAQLAGASTWKQFTKITVPLIKDVIETSLVLWTIFAFKIFGYLYVFGAGGAGADAPPPVRNISVQLFLTAFGKRTPINRLAYASAMAIVLLILVAILVYVIRNILMSAETIEY